MKFLLIIVLLLLHLFYQNEKVCLNPNGKPVDWYIIFLFPRSVSPDKEIYYAYFDSNLLSADYYLYNESSFPPSMVISYLNNNDSNYNYFAWNDGLPESKFSYNISKAHSKGFLIYDKNDGVFLSHSLPQFPKKINNKLLSGLTSNAGYYGQHFLCISITKETSEKIVEILNNINALVFASVKKDNVNKIENEWVKKLIINKYDIVHSINDKNFIKSKKGIEFTIFSKNNYNLVTPYDTVLRQNYLDDFYIRTWILPKLVPAICEKYSIFNVDKIQFGEYKYDKNKDHAKWAISVFKNIVCFGDLNHCESQKIRGGMLICFENEALHNFMIDTIYSTDSCV